LKMNNDTVLREHLLYLLRGGGAHATFEDAVRDFPVELRGKKVKGVPHSPWELLEHMRIAQWDILEFSRNGKHVSPDFPQGYWPPTEGPPNDAAWNDSVNRFQTDAAELQQLVEASATDLYKRIPHGDGQTVLREALLVADHNAYHLGQFVLLRRLLGAWKG
jgi:hypothetical protein